MFSVCFCILDVPPPETIPKARFYLLVWSDFFSPKYSSIQFLSQKSFCGVLKRKKNAASFIKALITLKTLTPAS